MSCDIIIPIYNAINAFTQCIDSVKKNTNLSLDRLILINDKSTDPSIEAYLKSLKKSNPEIMILNNDENLGFVKTVNKGMKLSKQDVLLLNSDTIVTPNWLDKIKRAAYSDARIATVTPLTNNGTICSVPNFLEDNTIPEGLTLDEFALLIERMSFKKYPIIPTAVGFCMYIKRDALDKVGLFDEINFGKGYGEENDFCCRVIDSGYINVLADDTYVYHHGQQSFQGERAMVIEKHLNIIDNKHPKYRASVAQFVEENPLKYLHDLIKLSIAANKNNKKNIIYTIHNFELPDESGIIGKPGGTEYHLKDLINNLPNYNKFILVSKYHELVLFAYIDKEMFIFNFGMSEVLKFDSIFSKGYEEILTLILIKFDIDLIHVQHFFRHTLDIPNIAKKLSIPCVITLHDFHAMCPTIVLLDANNVYCEKTRNDEMCDKCIKIKLGSNINFLKTWQMQMPAFLFGFKKIYVPSYSTKAIIEEFYGDLNIEVIEHGVDKAEATASKNCRNGKFRIAFTSVLTLHKGKEIIEKLLLNSNNKNIEWHLFGDGELDPSLADKIILHGRYKRESIVNFLKEHDINLICNFSIFPETYSYTLTDAWLAGIPVLAHDIGALGERVKAHQGGWVIPVGSTPAEIMDKIDAIVKNRKDFMEKKNNIKNMKFMSKPEMAKVYELDYERLFNTKVNEHLIESNIIYKEEVSVFDIPPIPHTLEVVSRIEDNLLRRVFRLLKRKMPQGIKNFVKKIIRYEKIRQMWSAE